jgi:hypothetical protein
MRSKLLVIPAALAVAVVAVAAGCSDDTTTETTTATGTGTGSGTASGTPTGMEYPPCPETCTGAECTCSPCLTEDDVIACIDPFCGFDPATKDCEPIA